MLERQAAELLTLPRPPDVGTGGEVVGEQVTGLPSSRLDIRDTLKQDPYRVGEVASIRRADLLLQENFDVVALGIDAAESIKAGNSLEKMLAHQMAVAHEMAMRMANRALSYEGDEPGEQVKACRLPNASARLMRTFQDGLLTLQRIRSGGHRDRAARQCGIGRPGSHWQRANRGPPTIRTGALRRV